MGIGITILKWPLKPLSLTMWLSAHLQNLDKEDHVVMSIRPYTSLVSPILSLGVLYYCKRYKLKQRDAKKVIARDATIQGYHSGLTTDVSPLLGDELRKLVSA